VVILEDKFLLERFFGICCCGGAAGIVVVAVIAGNDVLTSGTFSEFWPFIVLECASDSFLTETRGGGGGGDTPVANVVLVVEAILFVLFAGCDVVVDDDG